MGRVRVLAMLLTAILVTVLTGCGQQDGDRSGQAVSPASDDASPSAEQSAAEVRGTTSGATDPAAGTPEEMLLTSADLPGLEPGHRWRSLDTTSRESAKRHAWVCQTSTFTKLGAQQFWKRAFAGGDIKHARASSTVLVFADEAQATEALRVMGTWHRQCAITLAKAKLRGARVLTKPATVEAGEDTATWRMVEYGPVEGFPKARYFDATGYTRKGSRITVTTVIDAGRAAPTYPAGEEPIVGALRNAAAKLP